MIEKTGWSLDYIRSMDPGDRATLLEAWRARDMAKAARARGRR